MKRSIWSLLVIFLLHQTKISAHGVVYITIHGTWGSKGEWYQPPGEFFTTLQNSAHKYGGTVVPFSWNGKNKHKYRVQAAEELETFIIENFTPDTIINIVSHSHGTNVAILASKRLALRPDNKHTIHAMYAFGTPVNVDYYMPDMDVIKHFYHFFSFNDFVQPVLGMYNRQYPAHERIANLRLFVSGAQPSHNGLHSPLVAEWIPDIHHALHANGTGNFESFDFIIPGIIYFDHNSYPRYDYDHKRTTLLAEDTKRRTSLYNRIFRALWTKHANATPRIHASLRLS